MTHEILMERHAFTVDQKLQWFGYGEWVEEIDLFFFRCNGYECRVTRSLRIKTFDQKGVFGGHLCGYICLPEEHPYFTYKYSEIPVDCHGGITYKSREWIGFDCGHAGDYVPTVQLQRNKNKIMKELMERLQAEDALKDCCVMNPIYRNMSYCIKECENITMQLEKVRL